MNDDATSIKLARTFALIVKKHLEKAWEERWGDHNKLRLRTLGGAKAFEAEEYFM